MFAEDPGAAERERTWWSPLFIFLLLSRDSGTHANIPRQKNFLWGIFPKSLSRSPLVNPPFGEAHLRQALLAWRLHYNRGRPHSSLGPGLPAPPPGLPAAPIAGYDLPRDVRVVARSILGGLHHEYGLERLAG